MPQEPTITIAGQHVVSEVIDGEAIIIDMQTGTYFSVNPSGSIIWSHLLHGPHTRSALEASLRSSYGDLDSAHVTGDLDAFLHELTEHALITQVDAATHAEPGHVAPANASDTGYEPPRLEIHTDMQDFLLVDPIHEVDEEGRPQPPREP